MADRIDALKGEVSRARSQAEMRAGTIEPAGGELAGGDGAAGGWRRRAWIWRWWIALAVGLLLVGLVVGLVVAEPGRAKPRPAITVPVTPRPPTLPPTPGPTATVPSITVPPTVPPTTVPTAPGPTSQPPPPAIVVVQPGQSFWTIATGLVQQRLRTPPTPAQVGPFWLDLIAANAARLPEPGNPDLMYPGQMLVVPAS